MVLTTLEFHRQQLDELEERAAELDRQRTKNISSVTYINERNRTNNIKVVENAMVKKCFTQSFSLSSPRALNTLLMITDLLGERVSYSKNASS